MRIAMIGSRGLGTSYGGIERVLDELCPRLAELGHRVDVFSRYEAEFEDRAGLRAVRTPSIGGKHFDTITRASSALVQAIGRYDLIHFHAVGPGILTLATRLFGQKSLVTIHGLDYNRDKWGRAARSSLKLAERVLVANADKISVVSESLLFYFNDEYDVDAAFIPNGLTPQQPVAPGPMLASFGLAPQRYVFFASRLTPEKGCHDLIAAFNALNTDMKLVIAGGSGTSEYLASLRGLADPQKVCFVGHRTGAELAEFFSNAYLFALPSYIEGMSMALLESLSFGVPAIVSDIPENAAVVKDDGFYFAKRDIVGLRAALTQLIEAPQIVEDMRGRLKQASRPSWDSVAQNYDALYRRIVTPEEKLESVSRWNHSETRGVSLTENSKIASAMRLVLHGQDRTD
jgi:glycosyltransferase involved in cell wall biosynthesis